jgi:hypothetical protein
MRCNVRATSGSEASERAISAKRLAEGSFGGSEAGREEASITPSFHPATAVASGSSPPVQPVAPIVTG